MAQPQPRGAGRGEKGVDRLVGLGRREGGRAVGRVEADPESAPPLDRLDRRAGKAERHRHPTIEGDQPACLLPRQIGDGAGDHEFPLAQDRHPIAELLDFAEEMAVDEHRHAAAAFLEKKIADLLPPHRINAVGRLVQEQDTGTVEEGLREPQPLFHPLGVAADPQLLPAGEAEEIEELGGAPTALAAGDPLEGAVEVEEARARVIVGEAVVFGQIADLATGGEGADRLAEEGSLSGRRGNEAEEDLDERRFPRAVLAEEAEQRGRFDVEADPPEGPVGAVVFFEVFDGNDHSDRSYQTATVGDVTGRGRQPRDSPRRKSPRGSSKGGGRHL